MSNSEAAFGALGIAARAAVPYLETALAENAVIELAPMADEARKKVAASVAEFRQDTDSVQVDAELLDMRLVDLAFDAKVLRVITEAEGTVRAAVMKLEDK